MVVRRSAPVEIVPYQQEGAGKERRGALQKQRCDPREDGKVNTQLQKSEMGALGDVGWNRLLPLFSLWGCTMLQSPPSLRGRGHLHTAALCGALQEGRSWL